MSTKSTADLLDALIDHLNLKNDAALAVRLQTFPPVISKLRHGSLTVGNAMMVRIHDATGWSMNEIRLLMGVQPVELKAA